MVTLGKQFILLQSQHTTELCSQNGGLTFLLHKLCLLSSQPILPERQLWHLTWPLTWKNMIFLPNLHMVEWDTNRRTGASSSTAHLCPWPILDPTPRILRTRPQVRVMWSLHGWWALGPQTLDQRLPLEWGCFLRNRPMMCQRTWVKNAQILKGPMTPVLPGGPLPISRYAILSSAADCVCSLPFRSHLLVQPRKMELEEMNCIIHVPCLGFPRKWKHPKKWSVWFKPSVSQHPRVHWTWSFF